jgi:biopolymer transport protein TolR
MLVLLIIFMVAAPMMTVGVPVDLPQTQAAALNSETQPITISVNADGQIHLQETPITAEEIAAKLQAISTTGYNERIFVRADTTSAYGIVADVMARIQQAGFKNIGLVTQQRQGNR